MTPIIPHFAEEINIVVRKNKDSFASLRPFPVADKKKINAKLESEEELIKHVKEDIEGIFNAIKKQGKKTLKSIEIFIANEWMYKVLAIRRKKPENLVKAIMAEEAIRKVGNTAVKYAQKLTKNPGLDPKLKAKSEFSAIEDALEYYKREFVAEEVKVNFASKSDNAKARIAEPGRPGIALTFE
ncbi:MAG: hypothetical protein ACTSSH_10560 [Candidatus Heimdallarchaeota archaeon]